MAQGPKGDGRRPETSKQKAISPIRKCGSPQVRTYVSLRAVDIVWGEGVPWCVGRGRTISQCQSINQSINQPLTADLIDSGAGPRGTDDRSDRRDRQCTEVHSGEQGPVLLQTKPILSRRHVWVTSQCAPFTEQAGPDLEQRRETAAGQPGARDGLPRYLSKSEGRS